MLLENKYLTKSEMICKNMVHTVIWLMVQFFTPLQQKYRYNIWKK